MFKLLQMQVGIHSSNKACHSKYLFFFILNPDKVTIFKVGTPFSCPWVVLFQFHFKIIAISIKKPPQSTGGTFWMLNAWKQDKKFERVYGGLCWPVNIKWELHLQHISKDQQGLRPYGFSFCHIIVLYLIIRPCNKMLVFCCSEAL